MTDRYLPVLSVGVGSHVAPMWPRGWSGPVWSRTPSGAPVLRDQGPDRPAGHGKADSSPWEVVDYAHGHKYFSTVDAVQPEPAPEGEMLNRQTTQRWRGTYLIGERPW
jgi:hypothetical protein